MVALVLTAGSPLLVPATGFWIAVNHCLRRRPWTRLVLNTSTITIGASVGVGFAALAGHDLSRPGAWWALAAAAAAVDAVSSAGTSWAIAITQERAVLPEIWRNLRNQAVRAWAGNVVVVIGALALYRYDPLLLLVVPPALFILYRLLRVYLHAVGQRDAVVALQRATLPTTTVAEAEVLPALVTRAVDTFGADHVDITLFPAAVAGPVRCWSGGRARAGAWTSSPLGRPAPLAASCDPDGTPEVIRFPGGASMALEAGGRVLGTLTLRFDSAAPDSTLEDGVLRTFAGASSALLLCAAQYELAAFDARHDRLTGLANRRSLEVSITAALEEGQPVTVLMVDLARFGLVNETLGHAVGDQLLLAVTGRLPGLLRAEDTGVVARIGGDEFAIALVGIGDAQVGITVAGRLLRRLAEPVELAGVRLPVEASIGIAFSPAVSTAAEAATTALLRHAETATARAKSSGRSVEVYTRARNGSSGQLALLGELQDVLDQPPGVPSPGGSRLLSYYQPKVDLNSGRVIGAEALARWQHPRRGLLQPDEFIPIVEASTLIHSFTHHILDAAAGEAARWNRSAPRDGAPFTVAVNLSPRCLTQADLPATVASVLARHSLPAHQLTLEITETLAIREIGLIDEVLADLHGLGVQLSVDDFGTGYSSLNFLERFPLNEVKIDRGFVGRADRKDSGAIVHATIGLAHALGLGVVAEGVETREQLHALRFAQCDQAQGYLFGRPMPAEAIVAIIGRVATDPVVVPPDRPEGRIIQLPAGRSGA